MAAVFSQAKDNKPGGLNRQAVGGIFEEVGRQAVKHCKQRPNGQRCAHQRQSRRKSLECVYIINHYVTRPAKREREPRPQGGGGGFFVRKSGKDFKKAFCSSPPQLVPFENSMCLRKYQNRIRGQF